MKSNFGNNNDGEKDKSLANSNNPDVPLSVVRCLLILPQDEMTHKAAGLSGYKFNVQVFSEKVEICTKWKNKHC